MHHGRGGRFGGGGVWGCSWLGDGIWVVGPRHGDTTISFLWPPCRQLRYIVLRVKPKLTEPTQVCPVSHALGSAPFQPNPPSRSPSPTATV